MRILPWILAAFCIFIQGSLGQEKNEWPQYRGNAGFTGVSSDDSVKPPLKLA